MSGAPGGGRVKAASLEDIGPVHPRGGNLDQDLAWSGAGYLALDQCDLLGAVGLRRHCSKH
jgi:hypothetical protein